MKRLNLLFLILGVVTIVFFGCKEDECPTPTPTEFTGTSIPVLPGDEGITTVLPDGRTLIDGQTAEWYEEATDWMVTGQSFWIVNWLIEKEPPFTAQLWGTAVINVGVKNTGDASRGKWELSWQGVQTPTQDGFKIVVDAVGTGTEGEVKGLFANWTYTMNYNGTPESMFYATAGTIK